MHREEFWQTPMPMEIPLPTPIPVQGWLRWQMQRETGHPTAIMHMDCWQRWLTHWAVWQSILMMQKDERPAKPLQMENIRDIRSMHQEMSWLLQTEMEIPYPSPLTGWEIKSKRTTAQEEHTAIPTMQSAIRHPWPMRKGIQRRIPIM